MLELLFTLLNQLHAPLDAAKLCAKAEAKTRLSDWGGDGFLEPLTVLLESIHREARLSQQGQFVLYQHYMRLLKNLLHIQNDWKRQPEISSVEIKAPIVILGFPRTGTTYLHQLMSNDPAHRTLRYWELLFPSPPPTPETPPNDWRIREARRFCFWIGKISPKLYSIHELDAMGAEECCFIFDHWFLDRINHLVFDVPAYVNWYDRYDHRASYQFHKKMLQSYALHFPQRRFLLKAPRHLFCLGALLEAYPDACIVWTHRDPLEALPSLCSLSETARAIVSNDIHPQRIGRRCLDHLAVEFASGFQARQTVGGHQFCDVAYNDLVRDPAKTVRDIYAHFGLDYSDEFDQSLSSELNRQRTRKHHPHRYSLEQYQLNEIEIKERLSDYYQQFGGLL
ncbi:sulfotransferase [bacterium]|nr:sulfotransferase [bacterium]